ncbi:MAG TPA: molybdopterin molybdenumtransferase MoeA, partial [Magnetospirillum sp.]|nr:molybdopterin molybdenumtransferase MoeA [Magnetospirillum sp.]
MTDFAPKPGSMRVDEALALLSERVAPLAGCETVPLAEALGRVLAEQVISGANVPPHDNSAVDGWGFAAAARP